jgi:hypothetical protein
LSSPCESFNIFPAEIFLGDWRAVQWVEYIGQIRREINSYYLVLLVHILEFLFYSCDGMMDACILSKEGGFILGWGIYVAFLRG